MNPTLLRWAIVLMLCIGFCLPMQAQGLIETMTEQIIKLELFLKETKQGYDIVKKGLSTISDIKTGDFHLHTLFLQGYALVNPTIKKWGKVPDMLRMDAEILEGSHTTLQAVRKSGTLSASTTQYIQEVYDQLTTQAGTDIDQLTGLLSDGQWQMNDEERIHQIDLLYPVVTEKFNFYRSFSAKVATLCQHVQHEKAALQQLQQNLTP